MTQNDINRSLPIKISDSGTGRTTFPAYSTLIGGAGGSGPLNNVPAAAANQFLTSSGSGKAPIWIPNSLILLQTQTFSGITHVVFTTGITNTYNAYCIIYSNLTSAVASSPTFMQTSVNGGVGWNSTYHGGNTTINVGSAGNSWGVSAQQSASIRTGSASYPGTVPASGEVYIFNARTTGQEPTIVATATFSDTGGVTNLFLEASGAVSQNINAIQFYSASQNISGTVSLYGVTS